MSRLSKMPFPKLSNLPGISRGSRVDKGNYKECSQIGQTRHVVDTSRLGMGVPYFACKRQIQHKQLERKTLL